MIAAADIHGAGRAAEYLAGWQRAQAELDNFRRRIEAERGVARSRLIEEVSASLLALADNFRAMTEHVPPAFAGDPWTEGVLLINRQLEQVLAELGVETIAAEGAAFDPRQHEAIGQEESAVSSGVVVEVVQPGYRVGDTVIRPARVKISA